MEIHFALRNATGALGEQGNRRTREALVVLLVQSDRRRWSRRSVELGILRRRAKPIGESRRSSIWEPCSLDEVGNSSTLQRRRRRRRRRSRSLWVELRRVVAAESLLVGMRNHTSVGRRLRDRAIRLTMLLGRLIEQDEVLLMRGKIQMLEFLLLRGLCRQAR